VPKDIQGFLDEYALDWWVGEVLARLSLWQRQNVMTELENMRGVRNPSGVVMARVKQVANTQELLTIFVDLNKIDQPVADELWALTEAQHCWRRRLPRGATDRGHGTWGIHPERA